MTTINTDRRVEFFDYLRALAVIFVVMAHYTGQILPGGSIGVSIFFCLSGFLIMTILLKEGEMTFLKAGAFIVRRFMRVFPAYLGAILIMLVLMKVTQSTKLPALLDALPGLLTFTKMPGPIGMETGVFWTLYVEFWFYVTMPFVVMLFGRGQALIGAVGFLISLSIFFKICPIINVYLPNLGPISSLIFWIDNLLYGSVVAIIASRDKIKIPRTAVPPLIYGALISLVAIAALISSEDGLIVWPFMATAASLLTAIIVSAYVSVQKNSFRIFSRAWIGISVAWIGKISYSIYLFHAIPLDYHAILPKVMIPGLPFIIIAVAATSYYLVEKPGISIGRRLAGHIQLAAGRPEPQN
jgi:peptidoglycan/LPS O-acetylase OafA/YrhL